MVQYVFTPWRDQGELLTVRQQFYPETARARGRERLAADTSDALDRLAKEDEDRQRAVARVSLWMHRGHCPHLIESTALLTASQLLERGQKVGSQQDSPAARSAIRASYATAFSRFVTGLLDGHQDKQHKMSMYSVAKEIGLPAAFVELRHQVTHEQLPSLAKLRASARNALNWIWEYYWKHLEEPRPAEGAAGDRASALVLDPDLYKAIKRCSGAGDAQYRKVFQDEVVSRYPEAEILQVLQQIPSSTREPRFLLTATRLLHELLLHQAPNTAAKTPDELHDVQIARGLMYVAKTKMKSLKGEADEGNRVEEGDDSTTVAPDSRSWVRDPDKWLPKPIGVV
jgi:hypothetical protein